MTIPEKAEDGEEEEFEENCQPTMVRFDKFLSDRSSVKTSPKWFSASKCDVGNWIFSNSGIF